ncbi:hypothetical protein [Roseomonas elaeocarpi]|uniref:Uncharacterized protein n=1 Tax=Roseomonas elaeocarpi TaxID=907779 RepID=A0ABV6JYD2_9PROT
MRFPLRAARRCLLAGAPLLLAGCGAISNPAPLPSSPQEVACREEASRSPEVKALMQQQPPNENAMWFARWKDEVSAAQSRGTVACLRRNGQPVAGGVEFVRPAGAAQPGDTSMR